MILRQEICCKVDKFTFKSNIACIWKFTDIFICDSSGYNHAKIYGRFSFIINAFVASFGVF